jgi:hypothetical protein
MVGKDSELSAAYRFLNEMDAQALSAEAQEPHSVIAYDAMTESYLVKGPFPDAHIATLEAERLKTELNEAAGHPDYPPITTWIALQLR